MNLNWQQLEQHLKDTPSSRKGNLLFTLAMDALEIECFYHHTSPETFQHLDALAKNAKVSEKLEALFQGQPVNTSENLPALHTQLREPNQSASNKAIFETMRVMSEKIRMKQWLGFTGKPIEDVIHIGIGGSDLSQRLTCSALENFNSHVVNIHFVANIDPEEMDDVLKKCNPETTLVIVASKSFATLEPCINLEYALHWFDDERACKTQVIAITGSSERAQKLGIAAENILTIPAGIGGRYSIWSAMGFILMVAIGYENFQAFLAGAHAMDTHVRETPFLGNIPVMLALMGIWNINFFKCQTHAIIPYSKRLSYLPMYLQQLDMESNGKCHSKSGEALSYKTGPIIWGGVGCNSQHSFHQLLHQGTHDVPVDFIKIEYSEEAQIADPRLRWLNYNCLAQVQTMAKNPRCFVNSITLKQLTPYTLGALLAMYEHKIYVQSQIWDINPFDQPGVEAAKKLAQDIFQNFTSPKR